MFLSLKNEVQLFYDHQDTSIRHFVFIFAGQFLLNIAVTTFYPARCAVKSDRNKNHCVSYIRSEIRWRSQRKRKGYQKQIGKVLGRQGEKSQLQQGV